MAKTLVVSSRNQASTTTPVHTSLFPNRTSFTVAESTEAITQRTFRFACTLSNLYMRIPANSKTTTSTFLIRVNGANGNSTISMTAGATGEFEDTSNTDSISAGDEATFNFSSGSAENITRAVWGCVVDASSNTTIPLGNGIYSGHMTTASATHFSNITGPSFWDATEANRNFEMRCGGTVANFQVNVSANTTSSTTTFGIRDNGATGNGLISVTAGATGIFEDNVNTDTISSGDTLGYYQTRGTGTGSANSTYSCEFTTTDSTFPFILSAVTTQTKNAGTTTYESISGGFTASTTETDMRAEAQFAMTLSNLEIFLTANTALATSTVRSRIDGADGNQVISILTLLTGWFEDTTNSDVVTAAQEINYSTVVGAGGTSIIMTTMGCKATTSAAATTVKDIIQMGLIAFAR